MDLRAHRKARGLSQDALAKILDIHVNTLYNAERGQSLSIKTAIKLCDFFGASRWEFLRVPKSSLAKRRLQLGYTQKELAKAIDVHEQTIINWEKGVSIPQGKKKEKLEKCIGTY